MDKYLRMMLIKLAPEYRVVVTSTLSYDDSTKSFKSFNKAKIYARGSKKLIAEISSANKRGLVGELAQWVTGRS